MKKNIIEETNERIQKMLNDRKSEIERRRRILKDAQAKKDDAATKKAAAMQADDSVAYSKAKAEEAEAQDLIDMTNDKIAFLENQDFVSKAEGREVEDDILAAIKKADSDLAKKLVKEIEAIIENYGAEAKRIQFDGNKVLAAWHRDICKDNSQPRKVEGWNAWNLLEQIINLPYYKELSGIESTVVDGIKRQRMI